jgi:flagellar L-ring protein precursor FlgH
MRTAFLRPVRLRALPVVLAAALVAGCAGQRAQPTLPAVPPPPPVEAYDAQGAARAAAYQENSIYVASGEMTSMFQDTKARRPGDIVTVKIEESSKASNKANTKTARDSSTTAGIDAMLGVETWWQDKLLRWLGSDVPKVNPFGSASVKGGMKSDFEGDGSTTRSGDLTAYITCRVSEVMPNGNLRIVGTREVMVNHENQVIILSGTIRPRDIGSNNVIRSIFVSDAKIAYSGTGVIDDRQRPGWLANFFEAVWPF